MKIKSGSSKRKPFWKRRFVTILGVIVVLLVVFRLLLPSLVLGYVNNRLARLKNYYGHAGKIEISLLTGSYVILDLNIVQIDIGATKAHQTDTIPFLAAPRIDLSIEWPALFMGSLVGEISLDKPVLNILRGKHKVEDIQTDSTDFRQILRDIMPLSVNHFEITEGQIHYIDENTRPVLDVAMTAVHIVAVNLKNVEDKNKSLPAHLDATGTTHGGQFELVLDFDGLNKVPTFDLNAQLRGLQLVQMNDFFQAYGNFDIERGTFTMFAEFAAREGRFRGYVKPILKDVKVLSLKRDEGRFGQMMWEFAIGGAIELLENQKRNEFATKIPIDGKLSEPHIHWSTAIGSIFRNAFVLALKPSLDNSVNIDQLGQNRKKGAPGKLPAIIPDKGKQKKNPPRTKTPV